MQRQETTNTGGLIMELSDIAYTNDGTIGYIEPTQSFLERTKIEINKARHVAETLHNGVVYGGGLVMTDQVRRTADIVAGNTDLSSITVKLATVAAWLHKSFEKKRINENSQPLTSAQIENMFGTQVANIVSQLATEPEDETKSKHDQWVEKAQWATTLCPEAQLILMAEKLVNFEVSRDRPNMKKPLAWHKEYYETRSLMVDALAPRFPELAKEINAVKEEGLAKIQQKQNEQAMMATRANSGNSL